MLRFDNIVFGPIHSRRLGASLGINLLPQDGKICNFDCIYCECGWNSEGANHSALPSREMVREALEKKLSDMAQSGEKLDSITFSGHGEPTLHPEFAGIIDDTVALRDRFFPYVQVSVLSNATMLHKDEVVQALRKVNNPILKLDAPFDEAAAAVNKPQGKYSVSGVVAGMKKFSGDFVLQTMMMGAPQFDFRKDDSALQAWKNIVRELKPRAVMVYTLDRPSPQKDLEKIPREEMAAMLADLIEEGININIY